MATTQYTFNVNRQDLDFILKQIKIAEASTLPDGSIARQTLLDQIGGVGAQASATALLPYGLRTVDGTWNNLLPGQERLGAADNIMPRLTALNLDAADPIPAGFPGAGTATTYNSASGFVFDAQPRLVSNLIVDQTAGNPAAVQAAGELAANGVLGVLPTFANGSLSIPNESPDIGLSPPFNGWMTIFGQFFDHGLDLIGKGGSGTVFVPLQPDDPLFVPGSPTNFMVLTRATNQPGPDGVVGDNPATPGVNESLDDIHEHNNSTTPYIDQNQTYTSHPSHQVFLREYSLVGGNVVSTGKLLSHTVAGVGTTGEGTWADVKAQAASLLGIQLTDQDIFNVPLLATDRYGEFIARRERLRAGRHGDAAWSKATRPPTAAWAFRCRRTRCAPATLSSTTSRTTRRRGPLTTTAIPPRRRSTRPPMPTRPPAHRTRRSTRRCRWAAPTCRSCRNPRAPTTTKRSTATSSPATAAATRTSA